MLEGNRDPISKMIDQLKMRLQTVVPGDVLAPRCALAHELGEKFDIVSTHFCPQDIYDNAAQLESGLSNIASLVSPGGYLVTSLLEQPTFPSRQENSPKISAQRLRELLNTYKFAIVMERHSGNLIKGLQDSIPDLQGLRSSGLMCVAARKCI
jgi:hypothetical protein